MFTTFLRRKAGGDLWSHKIHDCLIGAEDLCRLEIMYFYLVANNGDMQWTSLTGCKALQCLIAFTKALYVIIVLSSTIAF